MTTILSQEVSRPKQTISGFRHSSSTSRQRSRSQKSKCCNAGENYSSCCFTCFLQRKEITARNAPVQVQNTLSIIAQQNRATIAKNPPKVPPQRPNGPNVHIQQQQIMTHNEHLDEEIPTFKPQKLMFENHVTIIRHSAGVTGKTLRQIIGRHLWTTLYSSLGR